MVQYCSCSSTHCVGHQPPRLSLLGAVTTHTGSSVVCHVVAAAAFANLQCVQHGGHGGRDLLKGFCDIQNSFFCCCWITRHVQETDPVGLMCTHTHTRRNKWMMWLCVCVRGLREEKEEGKGKQPSFPPPPRPSPSASLRHQSRLSIQSSFSSSSLSPPPSVQQTKATHHHSPPLCKGGVAQKEEEEWDSRGRRRRTKKSKAWYRLPNPSPSTLEEGRCMWMREAAIHGQVRGRTNVRRRHGDKKIAISTQKCPHSRLTCQHCYRRSSS